MGLDYGGGRVHSDLLSAFLCEQEWRRKGCKQTKCEWCRVTSDGGRPVEKWRVRKKKSFLVSQSNISPSKVRPCIFAVLSSCESSLIVLDNDSSYGELQEHFFQRYLGLTFGDILRILEYLKGILGVFDKMGEVFQKT